MTTGISDIRNKHLIVADIVNSYSGYPE